MNILRPGDALNLPLPDASASTNLKTASLSLKEFITHLVPRSVIEARTESVQRDETVLVCRGLPVVGVIVVQLAATRASVKAGNSFDFRIISG